MVIINVLQRDRVLAAMHELRKRMAELEARITEEKHEKARTSNQ
jgi:hypothetical protein